MYYGILNMDWKEVLTSEYFFKSNSRRRVIEMVGKDLEDSISDESAVLIVYDMLSDKPILLVEKFHHKIQSDILIGLSDKIPEKFNVNIEEGEDSDGSYTEVVLVRKSLQNTLTDRT